MSSLTLLQPDAPLSYLLAFGLPLLDALVPVVPSETAIIALGVATAGSTDPRIAVLVALAALGALLGDNAAYEVGRRFRHTVRRRFFSTPKGVRREVWAARALERLGARLILVCRFIPGGRTAVTLTCGMVGYPRRRFVIATSVAAVAWASYAFLVGRLGGKAFEQRPWLGLVLALGAALAVSLLIEAGRRLRHRQARPHDAERGDAR